MIGHDGEVLVHADSSHNLNENFFDEVEDDRELKGTVERGRNYIFREQNFMEKKRPAVYAS